MYKTLRFFTATAATAICLAPIASNAAVIFSGSDVTGGSIVDNTVDPTNSERLLTFVSQQTPFFAYQDFSTVEVFDLTLQNYLPVDSGVANSFFTLINLDTNFASTTNAGTCSSSGNLVVIDGLSCSYVNGTGGSSSNPNPPPISFLDLIAGNYRLGVYETGDPSSVQFDFVISEDVNQPPAVPLPAAGFMLLAGLGAFGFMRRVQNS